MMMMMMQSIALTSLLVLLGLTTLTLEHEGDCGECGGLLSIIPFDDMHRAIQYFHQCSIPTCKFNASCILSSCPLLKGVCPLNSTSGLNKAVSIINQCVGQSGLVCGINLTRMPMVQLGWTTAKLVPASLASGTIILNPGTGYISNLNKASFSVVQPINPNGPITLAIKATNLTNTASHNCTFTIAQVSVIRSLASLIPSVASVAPELNTPDMIGICQLNLTSTVAIDLSTQPPTITILDDHSSINFDFINFVTLSGEVVPSFVVDPFSTMMNDFLSESDTLSISTNFLATYAAQALQGAQEGCS